MTFSRPDHIGQMGLKYLFEIRNINILWIPISVKFPKFYLQYFDIFHVKIGFIEVEILIGNKFCISSCVVPIVRSSSVTVWVTNGGELPTHRVDYTYKINLCSQFFAWLKFTRSQKIRELSGIFYDDLIIKMVFYFRRKSQNFVKNSSVKKLFCYTLIIIECYIYMLSRYIL